MVNKLHQKHVWLSRAFAAAALLLLAAGQSAFGQDPAAADPTAPAADGKNGKKWKEIPIPNDLGPRSAVRAQAEGELRSMRLGDPALSETTKQTVETVIVRWKIAEMTHVANLATLTDKRQDLRTQYLRFPNMPEALHTYVNELIFTNMNRIAHDEAFHPAVRVNAMYMIADLNQREPSPPFARPPVYAQPLAAALTARGGLLDSAADATLHPAVRAIAVFGVQRHADAKGSIAAANQAAVLTSMTSALKEKLPGNADSQTVWLKMRAADVLGTLGVADPPGSVAGALGATIADASAPVAVRCAAARALGKLKGLTAGMIQMPDVIAGLGNLQLDLCRAELDRALYEQDTVSPRQIHYRTSSVQAALGDGKVGGIVILVAEGDAQKALLDGIATSVSETLALVPDENADPTEQLKVKADELEKLLAANNVLKSQPRATAAPATTAPATTSAAGDGKSAANIPAAATAAAKAN